MKRILLIEKKFNPERFLPVYSNHPPGAYYVELFTNKKRLDQDLQNIKTISPKLYMYVLKKQHKEDGLEWCSFGSGQYFLMKT